MTQAEVDRICELSAKMDRAAERQGRTYTDTADLSVSERAEYRRLIDKTQDEWPEPQQCPAAFLGGEDDGRIGILTDAAW